jgi:hypothetical protein
MKAGALTPAFLFARGLFYYATSLRVMPALVAGIHAKSAQRRRVDGRDRPTAVRLIFVDKAHGVDSSWFESFGDGFGHEKETTPCGIKIAYFIRSRSIFLGARLSVLWRNTAQMRACAS